MSWLDIKPLPKSERRRIIREQGGTFSTFPPDLDLLASTKALKLVQEAKLTLPNFATQEVAKYMMARNAGTIRMCGTVLSRVRELQTDLTPGSEPGEDRDSDSESMDVPTSVPSHVLLELLSPAGLGDRHANFDAAFGVSPHRVGPGSSPSPPGSDQETERGFHEP